MPGDFAVDGEIVALDASFEARRRVSPNCVKRSGLKPRANSCSPFGLRGQSSLAQSSNIPSFSMERTSNFVTPSCGAINRPKQPLSAPFPPPVIPQLFKLNLTFSAPSIISNENSAAENSSASVFALIFSANSLILITRRSLSFKGTESIDFPAVPAVTLLVSCESPFGLLPVCLDHSAECPVSNADRQSGQSPQRDISIYLLTNEPCAARAMYSCDKL